MIGYDKYYKTENLFGEPYVELIEYMNQQARGAVLDLGCGQGRDAIGLARLGFSVMGVDHSQVGINQMLESASKENLSLSGQVADIFEFNDLAIYDVILMDSMFHFAKKDKKKEINLIKKIISGMGTTAKLIVCIQDTGQKVNILKQTIEEAKARSIFELQFTHEFEDQTSDQKSKTDYLMIVVRKTK